MGCGTGLYHPSWVPCSFIICVPQSPTLFLAIGHADINPFFLHANDKSHKWSSTGLDNEISKKYLGKNYLFEFKNWWCMFYSLYSRDLKAPLGVLIGKMMIVSTYWNPCLDDDPYWSPPLSPSSSSLWSFPFLAPCIPMSSKCDCNKPSKYCSKRHPPCGISLLLHRMNWTEHPWNCTLTKTEGFLPQEDINPTQRYSQLHHLSNFKANLRMFDASEPQTRHTSPATSTFQLFSNIHSQHAPEHLYPTPNIKTNVPPSITKTHLSRSASSMTFRSCTPKSTI